MEFIEVNSPEYRALMIKAIKEKNVYLIEQLKGVPESGCSRVVVLNTFFELFMYSTCEQESVYELYTNKSEFAFFYRDDLEDIREEED